MNKFIDQLNYHFYAHTWSFMDVIVVLLIIPFLCREYSYWLLLLLIPWLLYSHRQAQIWNNWGK